MLNLVTLGFENLVLSTVDAAKAEEWLFQQVDGKSFAEKAVSAEESHGYTLVFLQAEEGYRTITVPHCAAYVLSEIYAAEEFPMIAEARTLPKTIFMNVGKEIADVEAIKSAMVKELGGIKAMLSEVAEIPSKEGALVYFLHESKENQGSMAYEECLYIDGDYAETLAYLKIHAPRYLAQAYATDAWHMVDIRLHDTNMKYKEQYRRVMMAIEALGLGYVVNEAWNRETPLFDAPVGTYGIRLLTFMQPMELKIYLMALEYDMQGKRIVNLDVFYHGKKISWRDVMDVKEIRKMVLGGGFQLPKSIFFAETSDKAALLEFATKLLREKLPTESVSELNEWEDAIDGE